MFLVFWIPLVNTILERFSLEFGNILEMETDLRGQLVQNYFCVGLHQKEMIEILRTIHNITIHPRTLKRILKKRGLYRRRDYTDLEEVSCFIEDQLNTSGQLHGYRWMHLKCIQHGFTVTQETVREILLLLDPNGVSLRKQKRLRRRQYINNGPNSIWHMDSYDKLKQYGICVNGAIDGYSRHIIWLNAGRTASDPKVIAGYYLNAIKSLGGCPRTVRADMGTENGTVEKIQTALRQVFLEGENHKPPFIYGKSTSNTRIESWWCQLRKQNAQYWMNLFETLKDEGQFNGTYVDKSLIQFCFLNVIQDELDQMVYQWNSHRIRKQKNSRMPSGRPIMMYQVPSLFNAVNKLVPVPLAVLSNLDRECTFYDSVCEKDIIELCQDLIVESQLSSNCNDPYDAVKLYVELRGKIYKLLE